MANRLFDLNETKGTFQVRGIVSGVEKDSFFTEKKTTTGKPRRQISFGIHYENDGFLYVGLNGMEQDVVYVSKREDDGTTKVEKVNWEDRFSLEEGFSPIGTRVGLKKVEDRNGLFKNEVKTLHSFDACKYVAENLKDGMSVYVSGNIEYSSFTTAQGEKRNSVKLNAGRIFLCDHDIDLDSLDETSENNKPVDDFEQRIVFMGIEKEKKDDVETNRAIVSAKIVSYNSVDNAEFILPNISQQKKFLKNLRELHPYTSIDIFGRIVGKIEEETVEDEDDGWGGPNPMARINRPYTREFVIVGAVKTSIDETLYNEENITAAINSVNNSKKADRDFGTVKTVDADDGWGGTMDINDEDDDW